MAAGWALDLFRGTQTREHGDIEIAVPAATFPEIRDRFTGYAFDAGGSGRIWEDASPDVLAATHQTWLPRQPHFVTCGLSRALWPGTLHTSGP